MKITIAGDPISKQRPRVCKTNTYDPQHKQKLRIESYLLETLKDWDKNRHNSWEMHISFFFNPCKSNSSQERNEKLWGFTAHTIKPDCTNLYKFYEDCANDIAYLDDCKIVVGSFKKRWSEQPRTEIEIMPGSNVALSGESKKVLAVFKPMEAREFFEDAGIFIAHLDQVCAENCELIDTQSLDDAAQWIKAFSNKYGKYIDKVRKIK